MPHQGEAAMFQSIKSAIGQVIVGCESTVEALLCALVAQGHVLLEDVPGTGKTVMAKSLARALDVSFSRIQFTPDLLPGDITGISVWSAPREDFVFRPGPVFAHILLADEINRATPRTQSALLECMAEGQVTTDGETRPLPPPFLVIATQNPVETQGTFPLPEAQMDRFLMRLSMGYPTKDQALEIIERHILGSPLHEIQPCVSREDLLAMQQKTPRIQVSAPVREYIAALCERTRALPQVSLGVSTRGMLALLRASQALALIRGREYVIPDDVRALAGPVLAHRVMVRGSLSGAEPGRLAVLEAMGMVPVPTEV